MTRTARRACRAATLLACALGLSAVAAQAKVPAGASHARPATASGVARAVPQRAAAPRPGLDRSGRRRVGKASYYAGRFAGRRMADGTRMDPRRHAAASRTLPLGTRARVRNLENGRSAVVTIRDRGPCVRGRIVDLSPATAREIGFAPEDGVVDVEVTPISIPRPGGGMMPGEAADDAGP